MMKPDFWAFLAAAARRAPAELPADMPFGFDMRVVAEWRPERAWEETFSGLAMLRVGLACAGVILLLIVAVNYHALNEREPGSVAMADSALRMSTLP